MTIKFNETTERWELGDIANGQLLAIVKGTALLASSKNHPYKEATEVSEFFTSELYMPKRMKPRRHFKIRAKERISGRTVTPEYIGYKSRAEIIEFFGLEEPDIEWYDITEVTTKDITPKNNNNGTMD